MNPQTLLTAMTLIFFVMGFATFLAGILILIFRASGKEVKALAAQTARLTQKGLAEELSGLVGNANSLVESLNQLIRTSAGIGVFLTVLGVLLMAASCWLAYNVYQMSL
jgi:hypothetical protein